MEENTKMVITFATFTTPVGRRRREKSAHVEKSRVEGKSANGIQKVIMESIKRTMLKAVICPLMLS